MTSTVGRLAPLIVAAVGLGAVGCTPGACACPSVPVPAPSTANRSWASVADLKKVAVASGYPCESWRQDNRVKLAIQSGTCSGTDDLAVYRQNWQKLKQLAAYQKIDKRGSGMGTVVGPNWTIHGPRREITAPGFDLLGGEVYVY